MNNIKEHILRTYNDIGADTLEKYWGQIEYTAYWCTHLLLPNSHLERVIPESIEDVVLDKGTGFELHQVKCRDESRPPWTTAEVIPILCDLYNKRHAFEKDCEYHFVSDHLADTKTELRNGSYGSLQRLKHFLEIFHLDNNFLPKEQEEFNNLKRVVIQKIIDTLSLKFGENNNNFEDGVELLNKTYIDTNSKLVRGRPNLQELAYALEISCLDIQSPNILTLERIYNRLLIHIVEKTIRGTSVDARSITKVEVMNCRNEPISVDGKHPNLDDLPGKTVIEKKAIYAGFHLSEIPIFTRQFIRASEKSRLFSILGLEENVNDFSLALMSKQNYYRREISDERKTIGIGPNIYQKIQEDLPTLIQTYLPNVKQADEVYGLGLLWKATDECLLWWECLDTGD